VKNTSSQIKKISEKLYSKEYQIKQVIRAKQFIDENYSKKISVEDLARKADMTKFAFAQLFKSYYGKTPLKYMSAIRIVHSKSLLNSKMTIAEVSTAAGFTNVSSFSELFKTQTGATPMAFRKKEKMKKNRLLLSLQLAQSKKKKKRK